MTQGPASIRAIKKRFKKHTNVGRRCKTYAPGCIVCECYRFLLDRGGFPSSFDEAYEYSETHDPDFPSISWAELANNPIYARKGA